jgi:hypothetical protein
MIPNVIHFIDVGGREFSFTHYLVVMSAYKVNTPENICYHCGIEPQGKWWETVKKYVTVKNRKIPLEIFGNSLTYRAHQSDVMRLEILLEYGGIYLDLDAISVNSLSPLLNHQMVMGREPESGLGSGVILAQKNSEFLGIWYERYRDYDGTRWNYHSVQLPWELALRYPSLIYIVDQYAFYYPKYNDPSSALLWGVPFRGRAKTMLRNTVLNMLIFALKQARIRQYEYRHPPLIHLIRGKEWQFQKLRRAYSVHLYESSWGKNYLSQITAESIFDPENPKYESNFSRLMRTVFQKPPWE